MRRDVVELWSPELGWSPRVVVHGSYGRPVLVFPTSEGRAEDSETNGMVDAVRPLIEAGRVKLYCLDSWDGGSWYRHDLPLEERARLHEAYERWVVEGAVPFVDADCGGRQDMAVDRLQLRRLPRGQPRAAPRRPVPARALLLRRLRPVASSGWGEHGHVASTSTTRCGRSAPPRASTSTGCARGCRCCSSAGRGMWEDTTGALESTRAFGALCAEKGLRVETDLWGHDVPHDWPSWRAQLAHHLPRFV